MHKNKLTMTFKVLIVYETFLKSQREPFYGAVELFYCSLFCRAINFRIVMLQTLNKPRKNKNKI